MPYTDNNNTDYTNNNGDSMCIVCVIHTSVYTILIIMLT